LLKSHLNGGNALPEYAQLMTAGAVIFSLTLALEAIAIWNIACYAPDRLRARRADGFRLFSMMPIFGMLVFLAGLLLSPSILS
jgi:hypothetical protein